MFVEVGEGDIQRERERGQVKRRQLARNMPHSMLFIALQVVGVLIMCESPVKEEHDNDNDDDDEEDDFDCDCDWEWQRYERPGRQSPPYK